MIVGDFDSIKQEVKEFYEKKNIPLIIKQDQDSCDLEKCLYIAIEKLGELDDSYQYSTSSISIMPNSLIILGCGGRIDHTFSTFHCVFKYLNNFRDQLSQTEIYLVSKRNISVFLKKGLNTIINHKIWMNFEMSYSIIPLSGEGHVTVYDKTIKSN